MTPQEIRGLRKKKSDELKALRLSKNITKSKISRETGLSRHTINRLEGGEEDWSMTSEIIYRQALDKL
jgi:transcriptional regulator with XRE-family HTH domain